MKQKKCITTDELAQELSKESVKLLNDKDKLKTKPEILDWLTRLYVFAAKRTIAQKGYTSRKFTGEQAVLVNEVSNQFTETMLLLHQFAEEKIAMLEEKMK